MELGAGVIGYLVQQQFLFPIAEIDVIFWLLAGIVVANTGPMVTRGQAAGGRGDPAGIAVGGGGGRRSARRSRRPPRVGFPTQSAAAATATTDRATSLRPDSIRYWLAAADASAGNGDLPAATGRLDRALSISPLDPILLATKGRILLAIAGSTGSEEDIDRVVAFYEELLAADPNNAQNQLRAGTAFALAGAPAAAEDAFLVAC